MRIRGLVIAPAVALLVAGTAAVSPSRATERAPCKSVTLSTGAGGNGMTGGTIAYWVSLTNRGRGGCEVQGRPWVRVPPRRYPVTVDDLRAGEYGGGPGRKLTLRPGGAARAHVLMMRGPCGGRQGDSATLTVRIGWGHRSVRATGEACLHEGATVAVGPFERL